MKKFIVSYPRSGNEWIRFLIANLISEGESIDFLNLNAFVPDIHTEPDYRVFRLNGAQFYKSHHREFHAYEDSKIVYLVRDGRDVAISAYELWCRENRLIKKLISWKRYLDIFLRGDLIFGKWKDHVWYWMIYAHSYEFIVVRYEDLVKDTAAELKKISKFFEINASENNIIASVNNSQYDKMKMLKDVLNSSRVGAHGRFEAWRQMFDEEDKEKYWDTVGNISKQVGYEKE